MQLAGEANQGKMGSTLRFEVSQVIALQQDKGNEKGKNKIYNRRRFMFKAVVHRPMSGEGVKEVIFNVPPLVPDLAELTTWELGKRERGGPPPTMIFDRFDPFLADALPSGYGLFSVKDAQGLLDPFCGGETFCIPEPDLAPRFIPKPGFHIAE